MRCTLHTHFQAPRAPQALLAAALCALAALPAAAQNSFGAPAPQTQQQQQQPIQQQPQQQRPQPLPPSAFGPQPMQQQPPAQGQRGMSPEQMTQAERQDMGVRAPAGLHTGAMHGPTPNTLPGGQVITTPGLVALLRSGGGGGGGGGGQGPQGEWQQGQPGQGQNQALRQTQALVFDVLGGPERLPGALNAVPAHQAGSFDDNVQREFGQFLQSVTQGRQDTPLVFYCQSMQCWMSYNAALRATRMGYRNVLWYRGGVEAWKAAGLPLQQAQQQQPQPQQQQQSRQ